MCGGGDLALTLAGPKTSLCPITSFDHGMLKWKYRFPVAAYLHFHYCSAANSLIYSLNDLVGQNV
jgi:hypothetical protein